MKNAILLHGKPSRERYDLAVAGKAPYPDEANWFPWTTARLQSQGIQTTVPRLPNPPSPVYACWKSVFEEHAVSSETLLVGHSAGAEFILRWLSEKPEQQTGPVVLVAPYHDYARKHGDFSEYSLDPDLVSRTGGLAVINSLDDDDNIQRSVGRLTSTLQHAQLHQFDGYGHFRIGHNMTDEAFPELLEVIQEISQE